MEEKFVMRKKAGKVLGLLVLVCSILLIIPSNAKAAEKIQCGPNVYGTLSETGVLTISGTGVMTDYEYGSTPFRSIDDKIFSVVIGNGVTSIGDYVFAGCDKLQSVSIGSGVKSIGTMTFYYTKDLFSIDIPGNVQTIGKSAFMSSSLKSVTFHTGLKSIGEYAFDSTNITSVNIPDGLTAIKANAFRWSSVSSVTIPENIGVIESGAFENVGVTFYSKDVTIVSGAFGSKSTFRADRGSSAAAYAENHGITLNYNQYPSTVYFNANGGTVNKKSMGVLSEANYGALPSAKRVGYKFVGWFTSANGGSQKKSTSIVTTTKDTTLYAQWKKITVAKCSKPTVTSTQAKKITVKIKKVSGATGYEIRYSKKSSMKSAKSVHTTSRTKKISNLTRGKKYYVQVRAYKKDSAGKKVYGSWSTKKSVKVKKK